MNAPPLESTSQRLPHTAADIRSWIVRELAKSLNSDPATIDPTAPLYSLGVDSLAAIGMTGSLAAWLNCDLPATLMWDFPNIDAIAEALADRETPEEAEPRPGVVDLQPNGDRRPLFYLPGLGGNPFWFAPVAHELGDSQPCYALIAPGFDTEGRPLTRIEEIAKAIVQNLRRVQARGPYQLAGYSFGGFVAFEAAQQLAAAGETVSLLGIFDTFAPGGRTLRPRWQRMGLHAYFLATEPGRREYLRKRLQSWRQAPHAKDPVGASNLASPDVRHNHAQASANYRPAAYPGSVQLFRATERAEHSRFYRLDPTNGWGAFARGGVQVVDLPGNHNKLLSAEHAPGVAQALRPFLSDLSPRRRAA